MSDYEKQQLLNQLKENEIRGCIQSKDLEHAISIIGNDKSFEITMRDYLELYHEKLEYYEEAKALAESIENYKNAILNEDEIIKYRKKMFKISSSFLTC